MIVAEYQNDKSPSAARRTRNVLIVAPNFPPSGLPPSHRARQFATHLPRYGWQPTVLTVQPEFYQEALEPELCALVPPDVEVIRTAAIRPRRQGGWGIGDLGARVLWHHGRAICRLCRERRIDLVYLPCPPNHQLLLARLVHARLGIPYVFDYIDPWMSDWLETHARPFTKLWVVHQLARHLEPIAIRRAAGITAVSQGTTEGVLRRYPHLPADRGVSIPYGAEPELYDAVRTRRPPDAHAPGVRRLLYLGAMWEAAHDTLRAFLAALRAVKDTAPDLYRTCRVDFVGTSYAPDASSCYQVRPFAEEAGVADVVTETPTRLPFLDALAALATTDTLLMLGSSETHYTPSRLLPYVFARRPILAVMNAASDATNLLRQHGGVRLVAYDADRPPHDRVAEIKAALLAWLAQPRSPDLPEPGEQWEAYTARSLTGRVAALFDQAVTPPGPAGETARAAEYEHV
jgi:glycosyl transferase family 4